MCWEEPIEWQERLYMCRTPFKAWRDGATSKLEKLGSDHEHSLDTGSYAGNEGATDLELNWASNLMKGCRLLRNVA